IAAKSSNAMLLLLGFSTAKPESPSFVIIPVGLAREFPAPVGLSQIEFRDLASRQPPGYPLLLTWVSPAPPCSADRPIIATPDGPDSCRATESIAQGIISRSKN